MLFRTDTTELSAAPMPDVAFRITDSVTSSFRDLTNYEMRTMRMMFQSYFLHT